MKKDIAVFVTTCPNCQQANVEHKKAGRFVPRYQHSYLEVGIFENRLDCWFTPYPIITRHDLGFSVSYEEVDSFHSQQGFLFGE